jgi:translation initiation factor IF-2
MLKPITYRPYYSLISREDDNRWYIQFGDYERNVVKDELNDYVDSMRYKKKDLKIIVSADDQDSINAAVSSLNA